MSSFKIPSSSAMRLDEVVRKVASPAPYRGFMRLGDEIIAEFPKETGFKPLTQWEGPLWFSGRTIFSHLDLLYHYGAMYG